MRERASFPRPTTCLRLAAHGLRSRELQLNAGAFGIARTGIEVPAPSPEEIAFVVGRLEAYFATYYSPHVAKEPPYSPMDGGAPPDMWVGEPNSEGWVDWHMLPSPVTDSEIAALETRLGVHIPSLYAAYLRARCHLFDQVVVSGTLLMLAPTPSDAPLAALEAQAVAWPQLLQAGHLSFGEYQDGWGPICFDLRSPSGDPPIVWFDHEDLHNLPPDALGSPDVLASSRRPLFGSFRELLDKLGS